MSATQAKFMPFSQDPQTHKDLSRLDMSSMFTLVAEAFSCFH